MARSKWRAKRDPRIIAANRKVRAAESERRRVLRQVQAECSHPVVAHANWRPSEYVGASPACRVCLTCGYEEFVRYGSATHWAGARTDACNRDLSLGFKYHTPLLLADSAVQPDVNPWDIRE